MGKLIYRQQPCGVGGSGSIIIGPSPQAWTSATNTVEVATDNTTGTEDIILVDSSPLTVHDTTGTDDGITNILRNLTTGEIIIAYSVTGTTDTMNAKRGVSMMQSAYNTGQTTFVYDMTDGDILEIVATWYDANWNSQFYIFEIRDGVVVRLGNEVLDLMSDQSGLLCRLMQGYSGEIEARFPRNMWAEYQKYLYGNTPHYVEQVNNTNVKDMTFYSANPGIKASRVSVIVMPEAWRTSTDSRDTVGDFIYKNCFMFSSCYPDAKQEWAFKKDAQVDFPIIYKAGKCEYLETLAVLNWLGSVNS